MTSAPREWNGWRYEPDTLIVAFYDQRGVFRYEVDLERCRTSAAMLDWIMQVARKGWATDAVLAGLVRAFNRLLRPQRYLCSYGKERGPINVKNVLAETAGERPPATVSRACRRPELRRTTLRLPRAASKAGQKFRP